MKHGTLWVNALFGFLLIGCASNGPVVSNSGYLIDWTAGGVHTVKALNQEAVIMQELDYSCGSAALATLMRYYFNDDVTEMSLLAEIKTLFGEKNFAVIEENGLSFKELEQVVSARGYQSASVQLSVSALEKLTGPILVYVEPGNYRHFAILRGTMDGRIYLADPSRGNISMTVDDFSKEWSGKSLILGKPGFGVPKQHSLALHQQTKPKANILSGQYSAGIHDYYIIPD